MLRVYYFLTVATALLAVTIATPARLTSRCEFTPSEGLYIRAWLTGTAVSSDVLQQLDLFSQYSAASYCSNNVDSHSNGTKITCAAGNCKSVENADTITLYQFSKYTTTPESRVKPNPNKQTNRANTASTGDFGDTTNHLLVVAFRGSRSIENFVADIIFQHEDVEDLCHGCSVHSGTWTAWQAVADQLTEKLKSAVAEYSRYTVVVTGHSLGGALATLRATALRNDGVGVDLVCCSSVLHIYIHPLLRGDTNCLVHLRFSESRQRSPS